MSIAEQKHTVVGALTKFLDGQTFKLCNDETNPAALPPQATDFLVALANHLKCMRVFEFGSGNSTLAFLHAGFTLTSLEDSQLWMEKTLAQVTAPTSQIYARVEKLKLSLQAGYPAMDWRLDSELKTRLRDADFVLIDSPLYTGFRESTLLASLRTCRAAVIVLDDLRIPAIKAFCQRIAAQNPDLYMRVVPIGHEMAVFFKDEPLKIRNKLSALDVLKGARRFFRYMLKGTS